MEEFLDGIVISQTANTPTISFSMPGDYQRGNRNPDLTGFQVYSDAGSSEDTFTYQLMTELPDPFYHYRVATTANITLSGLQTIDGVALSNGNRVLVKNQTDPKQNGTYTAASGAWSRTAEGGTDSNPVSSLEAWVQEGSVNGKTAWYLLTADPVTTNSERNFRAWSDKLGFISSYSSTRSVLGKVLASGQHQNFLNSGWETVRFGAPVTVTDAMLVARYWLVLSDTVSWPNSEIRYRILAGVADSGLDYFGNSVRNFVARSGPNNLISPNSYWMSKANPSKFAVEALYFDHLTEITIDSIEVDPLTPGMIMSVYYSSEGDPGNSPSDWDNKLWQRVPRTYHLRHKNEFFLPQPISARYIKLEFSKLQARPYRPGNFDRRVSYLKHPKWVLDYFLMDMERKRMDNMVPTEVDVIHDAYALAFSYYMDEERPLGPGRLGKIDGFKAFLERNDLVERVDPEMLSRISYALAPYQGGGKNTNSLLGSALSGLYRVNDAVSEGGAPDVQEELGAASTAIMTEVSTLNREKLMEELIYPDMFFFITCRHMYRQVEATFQSERAYFAGVQEVRFIRDTYTDKSSPQVYNELFTDSVNIEINDFAS